MMFEYQECIIVLSVHLLACEVAARIPVIPLARHRVVVTTQGSARGYYAPRPPHYAFLGLPYARPPIRYDRFKAPEPPPPWTGIFEATHRVKCPQPDGSGEENCLVVNVFSPESAEAAPVVVHLHDGDFQSGWGTFEPPQRLLEQGFIFISLNYRIGALGFLCLGIREVLGNAGIKDQVAALYWIYKNIDRFGGNPSDVTVYGTGSGAVSIEILLMTNLTRNLFHKAILESGSVLSPTAITRNPGLVAYNLAKFLGYRGEFNLQSLKEYYYKVPVNILTNISRIFRPCIEKTLPYSMLDGDPREILESGKYQHVPMIVVYTNTEEVDIIADNEKKINSNPDSVEHLLPNNLIFDNNYVKDKITKRIKKFYFEGIGTHDVAARLNDYTNDIFMEYPAARSATYHTDRNRNPVYFMKFHYKRHPNNNNREIATAEYTKILLYMTSGNLLYNDELIAQRLTRLWTNFINLGDPTPLTSPLLPVIWQPVETHEVGGKIVLQNIPCLEFGLTMVNTLLSGQHLKFWESIYEKFYINLYEY